MSEKGGMKQGRGRRRKGRKKTVFSPFTFLLLLALASVLGAVSSHRPVILLADVNVARAVIVDDEAA